MRDTKAAQGSAEGYQHGTDSSAGTRASPECFNIVFRQRNTSRRLSFSRLEVARMIAVVIFAILSTVFIVMYFTIDKNCNNHCGSCPVKANISMIQTMNTTTNMTTNASMNNTVNTTMWKTKNMPKKTSTGKLIICPITYF